MVSGSAWVAIVRAFLSAAAHNYHFISIKYARIMWSIDYLSIVFTLSYFAIQTNLLLFDCYNWNVKSSLTITYILLAISVGHSSLLHDKSVREVTFGFLALATVLYPLLFFGYMTAFHQFSDNKLFFTKLGTIDEPLFIAWICAIIAFIGAVILRALQFPEKWIHNKHKTNIADISMSTANSNNNSNGHNKLFTDHF